MGKLGVQCLRVGTFRHAQVRSTAGTSPVFPLTLPQFLVTADLASLQNGVLLHVCSDAEARPPALDFRSQERHLTMNTFLRRALFVGAALSALSLAPHALALGAGVLGLMVARRRAAAQSANG